MGYGPAQGYLPLPPISLREGSTPTTLSDFGRIYTKDVAGITELFYLDSSGNDVQVTSGGSLSESASLAIESAVFSPMPRAEIAASSTPSQFPFLRPETTRPLQSDQLLAQKVLGE